MFEELIKNKRMKSEKLIAFGFAKKGDSYFYEATILDGEFQLEILVAPSGNIDTQLFDTETKDEYSVYKTTASGEFVGQVRAAVREKVSAVISACYEDASFWHPQTMQLIDYVRNLYGDELEYPWADYAGAIWRRKDNGKWYGVVMAVAKNRLGLESNERVEILNLKIKIADLQEKTRDYPIFPAYHMNKKHWITIVLDGRVPNELLFSLLQESYACLKK